MSQNIVSIFIKSQHCTVTRWAVSQANFCARAAKADLTYHVTPENVLFASNIEMGSSELAKEINVPIFEKRKSKIVSHLCCC